MMNVKLLLFASLVAAPCGVASELSSLRFLNDDALPGRLLGLDRGGIAWDSPVLERQARFLPDQIRELRLPATMHMPASGINHRATLTLMNGDKLEGQLASVTDERIELDTWYAGRMVFRRNMVRNMEIDEMPDYVFRGPQTIDNWEQSADPPTWVFGDDNTLVSSGPAAIGRDIPLPDRFTLQFEAAWQGSLRLHLVLFSNDLTTDSPDQGYEIVFQRSSVHLRRCGTHNWIGHTNRAIDLAENERARIKVRACSRSGQFAFYINNKIIDIWTDPNIEADKLGTSLQFVSLDSSPLRIGRIDVAHWDGVVEDIPDPTPPHIGRMRMMGGRLLQGMPEEPADDDEGENAEGRMTLRNGDKLTGVVKSIEDGKITIETPFREVSLPVERLRTITLKPVDLEEPKREEGDVRAWFTDGGSIVFRLEGLDVESGRIQGTSQTFGSAMFDMVAFNRIEFNIYNLFDDDF